MDYTVTWCEGDLLSRWVRQDALPAHREDSLIKVASRNQTIGPSRKDLRRRILSEIYYSATSQTIFATRTSDDIVALSGENTQERENNFSLSLSLVMICISE